MLWCIVIHAGDGAAWPAKARATGAYGRRWRGVTGTGARDRYRRGAGCAGCPGGALLEWPRRRHADRRKQRARAAHAFSCFDGGSRGHPPFGKYWSQPFSAKVPTSQTMNDFWHIVFTFLGYGHDISNSEKSNWLYLRPSKSSQDPAVVIKFEFCAHSARLLRKLDHAFLWILINNTGLWQYSICVE